MIDPHYNILRVTKEEGAIIYGASAFDHATGTTGVGGINRSAATANNWKDVRFLHVASRADIGSPIAESIVPSFVVGAQEYIASTGTVLGGATPIGDIRGEGTGFVGIGTNTLLIQKDTTYSGALYAIYEGAGATSLTGKIGIGTTAGDISTSGYYEGTFKTKNIREFQPIFTVDTGDLTKITTGSGVYLNSDVTISSQILNREGVPLTTAAQVAADNFISGSRISILDSNGSVVFNDYKITTSPTFTFTHQDNVDVFGNHNRNFGIRTEIVNSDGNSHTSDFFLFGNSLSLNEVTVTASGVSQLNQSTGNVSIETGSIASQADIDEAIQGFSQGTINNTGVSGFIDLELFFNEDPSYTNYLNLAVYASNTGTGFNLTRGNFLGDFPLNQTQGQHVRLYPSDFGNYNKSNLNVEEDIYFKFRTQSDVAIDTDIFSIGPYRIEAKPVGNELFLGNGGEQTISGPNAKLSIDDGSQGGTIFANTYSGSGISGRITDPFGQLYLVSGEGSETDVDTLQTVTDRGSTTTNSITVGLTLDVADSVRHAGDTDTRLDFAPDQVKLVSNGITRLQTENAGVIINEGGVSADFRVEGDTDTHALFVDGSTDNVGIGTDTPSSKLEVVGKQKILNEAATDEKFVFDPEDGQTSLLKPSKLTIGTNPKTSNADYDVTYNKSSISAYDSIILSTGCAIVGGSGHTISGDFNMIAGGMSNQLSGCGFGFIGGGSGITVTGTNFSTSVGGDNNDIFLGTAHFLGGGQDNLITGSTLVSTIVGGFQNKIFGGNSNLIGGGDRNIITGSRDGATLVGGTNNQVSATLGFVGAGGTNVVHGPPQGGAILGGVGNSVSGAYSSSIGGFSNAVSGDYSIVGGYKAQIPDGVDGATVLADGQNRDHISSGSNTITLDFAGGLYVPTSGMFAQGLLVSGVPVSTGSAAEADTLATVTARGNSTSTSILSTGPHISGVTGFFSNRLHVGTPIGTHDCAIEAAHGSRQLIVSDTTSVAAGVGGKVDFFGAYTIGGARTLFGSIQAKKTNASAGHYGGGLALSTRVNGGGAATERLTILEGGNVGIGTVSPDATLQIKAGDTTGFLVQSSSDKNILWAEDTESVNVRQTLNVYHTTVASRYLQLGWGSVFANDNDNELSLGSNFSSASATRILLAAESADNIPPNTIQMQANHGLAIFSGSSSNTFEPTALIDVRGDGFISGSVKGTGAGNRITNNHIPYLLSGDSPAETQTLQDVCDNGNTTTTNINLSGGSLFGDTETPNIKLGNAGGAEFNYGTSKLINGGSLVWQGGGVEKFRVTAAGNVGIGTNSPSATFSIGSGDKRASNTDFVISDDTPQIELRDLAKSAIISFNDTQGVRIFSNYSTSTSPQFTIENDGNVGVGTSLPAQKLQVVGGISGEDIVLDAGNSSDMAIQFAGSSNGIYCDPVTQMRFAVDSASSAMVLSSNNIQFGAGGNSKLTWSTNNYLEFNGGGTKARLNSAGLGIGTTNPDGILNTSGGHVTLQGVNKGYIRAREERASTSDYTSVSSSILTLANYFGQNEYGQFVDNAGNFLIQKSGLATHLLKFSNTDILVSGFGIKFAKNQALANLAIDLRNENGDEVGFYSPATNVIGFVTDRTERMRIDSAGNVGIGTASAAATLDVKADTDTNVILGRARLGSYVSDYLYLSHYDHGSSVNYALKQSAGGTTALNAPAGQNVSLNVNNSEILFVKGSNSNVGIQTTSPTTELAVAGTISGVSGIYDQGLFISGVPVSTGSAAEADTLATVTARGNSTSTSIISTGPHISGGTGLFEDVLAKGAFGIHGWQGDPDTHMKGYGDRIVFTAGGLTFADFSEGSQDLIHFNGNENQDIDFRVGYDGGPSIFSRGSDGKVGIANSNPQQALDVSGSGVFSEKVGIGTNNPSGKLEINTSLSSSATLDMFQSVVTSYPSNTFLKGAYIELTDDSNAGGCSVFGIDVDVSHAKNHGSNRIYGVHSVLDGTAANNQYGGYFQAPTAAGYLGDHGDSAVVLINGKRGDGGTVGDILRVEDSDVEKFTIVGGGNVHISGDVGIGTNSPDTSLHIESSDDVLIKAVSTDGGAGIAIADHGSASETANVIRVESNDIAFKTNTSEKLRITAAGNVGIGTAVPSFTSGGGVQIMQPSQANLRLSDSSDSSFNLDLAMSNDDFFIINRSSGGHLKFRVNSSTEAITVLQDGKVGIGTTAPSDALSVNGHFSATSKSFLIDHPIKENKKLQYGSLEGPENGVYVRGTSNSAKIELPDYWSELVHEDSITVSLTALGKKQDLFVKSKSPEFIIVGGVDGSYDYVVYGERKDIDKLETEPLKV